MKHKGNILTCVVAMGILAVSLSAVALFSSLLPSYKNTVETLPYHTQDIPLQWQPADAPVLYPWSYYNSALCSAIDSTQRDRLEKKGLYQCFSALWRSTTGGVVPMTEDDLFHSEIVTRSVSDLNMDFFFLKGDTEKSQYADMALDEKGDLLYWCVGRNNAKPLPHEFPANRNTYLKKVMASSMCTDFLSVMQRVLMENQQTEVAELFSKLLNYGTGEFISLVSDHLVYITAFYDGTGSITLIYDWVIGKFVGFCL